ncbi:MAG: ribonuclease J [Parcubacteria group bacterium]|nr:ribonuclease J [Parcubacteria group bacterium]
MTPRFRRREPRRRPPESGRTAIRTLSETIPIEAHRFTGQHGSLRVIPLGGLEEVGKNMMAIQYERDLIVIDVGLNFPDETMFGIDYIIPDFTFLKQHQSDIRGIFITHGHMDHMGALPYILPKIGMPPVYGTKLTIGMIEDRLEEFHLVGRTNLRTITPDDVLKLGNFEISFFRVNHNIPDGVGIVVKTPEGVLVHTGDFKFDHTPAAGQLPAEFGKIAEIGDRGVLMLMSDSTNAEGPGYAISEKEIGKTLSQIIAEAPGRVMVTTFASLISRIQQTVDASIKYGRHVAFSGRSMEKTAEVAMRLGYLKVPKDFFIPIREVENVDPRRVTILATGSQGQSESALGRIASGDHKFIHIQKGDTVILSSSPIPGNERAIYALMDNLYRAGAKVIYSKIMGVHVSGHGYQEDLKLMLALVKPRYFMPIHGEHHMLVAHAQIAQDLGIPPEHVFIMENGQVVEIKTGVAQKAREKAPAGLILVDGLGVGDIGNVVLRDRQVMAQDGMLVLIAKIDNNTGQLVDEPDIISRGFVYMKESDELMRGAKAVVRDILNRNGHEKSIDHGELRAILRDELGKYLFKRTERQPMILPIILTV